MSTLNLTITDTANDGCEDGECLWNTAMITVGPGPSLPCQNNAGFYFPTVAIPSSSTINDGTHLHIYHSAKGSTDLYGKIRAELAVDPDPLSASRKPSTLTLTSAGIDWDAYLFNEYTQSPEMKTVIQEVVNQGGWASGNSMVIVIMRDADGYMAVISDYEGGTYSTLLDIEYASGVSESVEASACNATSNVAVPAFVTSKQTVINLYAISGSG